MFGVLIIAVCTTGALAAGPSQDLPLPNAPRQTAGMAGPANPFVLPRLDRVKDLTSRPSVWNKKFILTHALMFASIVYDDEVTHQGIAHHKCTEANASPHPSRGELYVKDLPVAVAVTAFDYFLARKHILIAPYTNPLVGAAKHFYGGTEWFTGNCF